MAQCCANALAALGVATASPMRPRQTGRLQRSRKQSPSLRLAARWACREPQRGALIARAVGGSSTAAGLQQQKEQLFALMGDNKGFDLSEAQVDEVLRAVEQLQALNPTTNPAATDLTGTKWKCIFTTSKGPSSGKIGPWIGENDQVPLPLFLIPTGETPTKYSRAPLPLLAICVDANSPVFC